MVSKKSKAKRNNRPQNVQKTSSVDDYEKGGIKDFYIKEYKKLLMVLIALFVVSLLVFAVNYATTGDIIKRDVTLKGGVSLTLNKEGIDINGLGNFLEKEFVQGSFNLRTLESGGSVIGVIIEASDVDGDEFIKKASQYTGATDYNVESMGSSLGDSFFRQMFASMLLAFAGMGIVFHYYFRNMYATGAALTSAIFDITITAAIATLFGMRLTAGGIAAYLMLIGYSIDTSILLSTKLLKDRQGSVEEAIFDAMKTGFTMSAAGIAATGISFLLTNNTTLKQIMLILILGLIFDLATTWIGNVSFLRMYLERKEKNRAD